jgi:DNA-directed RNA polymerase specialized sigma subunit
VKAFETYDPNRGAALNTHIRHQLKKAARFVTTYQNPARIPENRIYRIRELQDAEQILDEQFGRPPTQLEVADHLQWSPRQVDVLQREVRKARPFSQFEHDPASFSPSRHQEIIRLLPYDLTPEEKQVFEYIHGIGGKPKLEPGQIAQRLGMSAPKVSRLKKSIADKYNQYAG